MSSSTETATAFSPAQVIRWLGERRDNCARIAKFKYGADRKGWLEDEAYFIAAIELAAPSQIMFDTLSAIRAGVGYKTAAGTTLCRFCHSGLGDAEDLADLHEPDCMVHLVYAALAKANGESL